MPKKSCVPRASATRKPRCHATSASSGPYIRPSHVADREGLVEDAREGARRGAVEDRAAALGLGHAQVVSDPHLRGVAARVLDGAVRGDVGLEQAVVRPHGGDGARPGRRPLAEQVGLRREDVGLVDGDPAAGTGRRGPPRRLARSRARRSGESVGENAAALGEPRGQREVVERDHRLDAGVAQRAEHLAVPVEGGAVDLPRRGARCAPTRSTFGARRARATAGARRPPPSGATRRTPRRAGRRP